MRIIIRSLLVSLWFMALTFPIMCIKADMTVDPPTVRWNPVNALYMGCAVFLLSFVWRGMLVKRGNMSPEEAGLVWFFNFFKNARNKSLSFGLLSLLLGMLPASLALLGKNSVVLTAISSFDLFCLAAGCSCSIIFFSRKEKKLVSEIRQAAQYIMDNRQPRIAAMCCVTLIIGIIPFTTEMYQTTIITQAFIWVALGLGLNIVVGQTGLLVLGYMAFYAVGAYTYGIINHDYGLGFWAVLPLGGLLAMIAGLVLGFPVLRLKGDYLAIVTLGFGEIVNQLLKNWTDFTGGSKGIGSIPRPGLLGIEMNAAQGRIYVYYLSFLLAVFTIIAVSRLRDSRTGLAWMALREDEIACETMGIDKTKAKLTSFALGALWAGLGGVLFAAKNSFINPVPFTFIESATILCVVVLGGLGSIYGIVLGAFIIVLLPEYLRAFSEYRMLIFGASMVLMMVFRPQGLIAPKRKSWQVADPTLQNLSGAVASRKEL